MNFLYITRSIDPLAADHRPEAYDRYRFYAPMMSRLAEIGGGDVYLQTRYNPKDYRPGGTIERMERNFRLPKKYKTGDKIDMIVCAIFCPDDDITFNEDLNKFRQTLEDTGAPYIYHDSDKEFSTQDDQQDLFHPGNKNYFLQTISKLPEDDILRSRLRCVATSVPDADYHQILKDNLKVDVTYLPATFWGDWKDKFGYIPLSERKYDLTFLRDFYLNPKRSVILKNLGTGVSDISVLLGSRSGDPSSRGGYISHKVPTIDFDQMRQGATYNDLSKYMSKSRLTPSTSIYMRVTSKLFEAAESRTLALLFSPCFYSDVVDHPSEADAYLSQLALVIPGSTTVSQLITRIRSLTDEEYLKLVEVQDKLVETVFSIKSDYITSKLTKIITDYVGNVNG
ncbi:hypothetical protein EVB64_259 [Rhizobium phage RHph_TM61]|nr:hypothetical protein EVB64_259 [Rhizobium phage RHph_TM61]